MRNISKKIIYLMVMILSAQFTIADWSDDFEGYILNNSFWSGESQTTVPWYNVSNPIKYARIQVWDIGGSTNQKFIPLGWNNVTYSRSLGLFGSGDTVEVTAQVANYHATTTAGHPSWPLAGHIVLGGVALGIGGDDICYQVLSGAAPTATLDHTTVTRFAPALFKTWYDVKIVINQAAGANKADLYYKLSTNSDWIQIVSNLATNQDIGTNLFIKAYAGDYYSAFDNIQLRTVPAQVNCATVWEYGYGLSSDFNQDCYVDLKDVAIFAQTWFNCNDPLDIECVPNW